MARLLRDKPLEAFFALGRRLARVFAIGGAPMGVDWRHVDGRMTSASIYVGAVADDLSGYVLSQPAAHKLALLQTLPRGLRLLVRHLEIDLLGLDLGAWPVRAAWLDAGFLLGHLALMKRGEHAAIVREGAWRLAPQHAADVAMALKRLKKRDPEEWLQAIHEAARTGTIVAVPPPAPPQWVASPRQTAWRPLRVFVSYSALDKPQVLAIDGRLRDRVNIDVILDQRELRPGAELGIAIDDLIARSDWVLLCMSRHAGASHWVQQELDLARRRGTRIMPLRLDDAPLHAQLADVLHADFRAAFDDASNRLIATLTGSPALAFVARDTAGPVTAEPSVAQVDGPRGWHKRADLTLRLRAQELARVDSLLLTTIANWEFPQPDAFTTTIPMKRSHDAVLVRQPTGAKVAIRVDRALAAGETVEIRASLSTDHTGGTGMGLYPFLVGAELLVRGHAARCVGTILADLHGSEVRGCIRTGEAVFPMATDEVAQEVLSLLPAACVSDTRVLDNLRRMARLADPA